MTLFTLVLRGLRFHARAHAGVLLGAAIGSAALVGALVVGDSVRASLREAGLRRLGKTDVALASGDRLFRTALAADLERELAAGNHAPARVAAVLQLPAVAASQDGAARANRAQILGVDPAFWSFAPVQRTNRLGPEEGLLNAPLADQLRVRPGDTVILRVPKPSSFSRDAAISPQEDASVALRLKVVGIVSDTELGGFGLRAGSAPALNAFVSRPVLERAIRRPDRANLLLVQGATTAHARQALRNVWQLADAEVEVREWRESPRAGTGLELRSPRVFLDPPLVEAASRVFPGAVPVLSYFVNEIRAGANATPYSMITAMNALPVPLELPADQIVIGKWLASDLGVKAGDQLQVSYFVLGGERRLQERTNVFTVHSVAPMTGAAVDRTLMPDFPGLAEAESTRQWDSTLPIDLARIRPKDETYWKEYRGAPKAFISLAAGRELWQNRFGNCTAVRFSPGVGSNTVARICRVLDPATVGLAFDPVRDQALAAAAQAQDFGQLFLGFSIFLVVAALLLMGLLFQFGLEQRSGEVKTLLALGFSPLQARIIFLAEGLLVASAGGLAGALGGLAYARVMLWGLDTVWRGAIGQAQLGFYAAPSTLLLGALAASIVAALAIWLTVRRIAKQSRSREAGPHQTSKTLLRRTAIGLALAALLLTLWALATRRFASVGVFFGAGSLVLIAELLLTADWLGSLGTRTAGGLPNLVSLGVRGSARRRRRSVATLELLASGVFVVASIGVFRLGAARDASRRDSGTGGFALIAESTVPVVQDLNTAAGRDFFGLTASDLAGVEVVPLRVREGDEASCLNLNRAQKPRLLGVNPNKLAGRFLFAQAARGLPRAAGWDLLHSSVKNTAEIPAIGDANSIQWALGKKLGDTIDYVDEQGRAFKLKLVGALANSILQGSLLIDEAEFGSRFPGESGYRMFLVDAPAAKAGEVSAVLTRALEDYGLQVLPAARRLNEFNSVQNTYLGTFQVLGGLGLLLGSAGLGIVVLRNVLERRGELAVLTALGFPRRTVEWLVLAEHGSLLGLGLAAGLAAAAVAVLPSLLAPGAQAPGTSLYLTLAAVLLNGAVWTWAATRYALHGDLLQALRNE